MMQIPVYNLEKKEAGTIETPDKMFGSKWSPDLVHQVLITQQANSRNTVAHAKDRSEVRGGGKKPWKQKGTGRARHGSIRSPLWIGGGATFGPRKERIFKRKINKKMTQTAIFSILSKKFADKGVVIVDSFKPAKKTKEFSKMIKNIFDSKDTTTFIFSEKNKNNYKTVRNISRTAYLSPKSLNVYGLMWPKKIFIEKEAVGEIVNHYKLLK
jgi:large subunit ribosomal protein L4